VDHLDDRRASSLLAMAVLPASGRTPRL